MELKSYQVLNFSLKVNSLPGKDKTFKGPSSNRAICEQIESDAKSIGMDLSSGVIKNIIGLFFTHILSYMKKGDYIRIDELGDFGMSRKEKTKRNKREKEIFYAKYLYKKKRLSRKHFNLKVRNKWREYNLKRVEKGLPEWKFKDWCKVFKIYKKRIVYKPKVLVK